MKKLLAIAALALCIMVGACGHGKVDKEALMNKLNSTPSELTSEDYSNLICVLEEDIDQLKKIKDKENDELSAEDMQLAGEVLQIAFVLETANQKGDLDKSDVKRLEKLSKEIKE